MEFDELINQELDVDSPDFTAEDAKSAIETVSEDDFSVKATEHLKRMIDSGESGRTNYQRKKFAGSNYLVLCFGGSKAIFKMGWLTQ
jgi:hypothetical protein